MVRPANGKTHGKIYEEFGKKIAEAREAKGLSQKDASNKLGMPQSTYAGYETGTRKIPLSLIKEFSKFYQVSPDELIGKEVEKNSNTIDSRLNIESYSEDELNEILNYAEYIKSKRQIKTKK